MSDIDVKQRLDYIAEMSASTAQMAQEGGFDGLAHVLNGAAILARDLADQADNDT